MRRAFVSHSTADDSYVAELESFLRAAGFDDVFNDVSSIKPDEQFWLEIEKGITACDTLVVVITAASNASDWVRREVEFARTIGRRVIPLWVEDCPVPAVFQDRDVIDFRRRTRELLRADITRIFKYAPAELIGRGDELKLISDAWAKALRAENGRPNVLTFVALGGEGKTSLVAKWVVGEMSAKGWPGCDAAFAWSFYSQGTRDQVAASSDLFLKEALAFFAELEPEKEREEIKAFAASPAGAHEKGKALADLVGQRRSLLILDGLEPLQYAPTAPTPGELKDQGIAALLRALAATSHGLCVVTTRYSLPDLKAFWQTTAPEVKLLRLSRDAGVHLLKSFEVHGSDRRNIPFNNGKELLSEFEKLVEDVKGHALTLNLLGSYLRDAHAGDIRKRDLINFAEADAANEHRHHVVHVMDAYVRWLSPSGFWAWLRRLFRQTERETQVEGKKALAVLRLVGLFDRPVTDDCFGVLLKSPAISTLTESLVELYEAQRNTVLKRLEAAKLLTVNRDASGALVSLDTHPHLREYFARQLRTQQPDAWRAAHRRLYEHLCASTPDKPQPTLEDLQPLYQAVAHGCQAGLQQEADEKVYDARINRGQEFYSTNKIGAFASDLGAIACFFEQPWSRVSTALTESLQAWYLSQASFRLRALGRLTESLEPLRVGLENHLKLASWKNAAIQASNLSELELTLGEVAGAVGDAEQSVTYADRSGDADWPSIARVKVADALHQAGRRAEAETRFREAEQMQKEGQPDYPLLYSLRGFLYCELLLAAPERAAWQMVLGSARVSRAGLGVLAETNFSEASGAGSAGLAGEPSREVRSGEDAGASTRNACAPQIESCRAVSQRAAQTLKWVEMGGQGSLLDIALDHLTLGRAALYAAILENSDLRLLTSDLSHIDVAVAGLRSANRSDYLPRGLLTRAWLRFLEGQFTGPGSAQEDLDEAWEIAERGPMPLHMADIHLHRARLFGMTNVERRMTKETRSTSYLWESPEKNLAEARRLIEKHGYGRRMGELEDAEAAIHST